MKNEWFAVGYFGMLPFLSFLSFFFFHLVDICVGKRKLRLRTTVQARNTIAMHTGPFYD